MLSIPNMKFEQVISLCVLIVTKLNFKNLEL